MCLNCIKQGRPLLYANVEKPTQRLISRNTLQLYQNALHGFLCPVLANFYHDMHVVLGKNRPGNVLQTVISTYLPRCHYIVVCMFCTLYFWYLLCHVNCLSSFLASYSPLTANTKYTFFKGKVVCRDRADCRSTLLLSAAETLNRNTQDA